MAELKVPDDLIPAEVDLIGIDGNAFSIIGTVARALKKAGNTREVCDWYRTESMSGDYNHVLYVAMAVTDG
jgi:hypothetical protein